MYIKYLMLLIVIFVVAAVFIAGCGGGGIGVRLTGRVVDGGTGDPLGGVRLALGPVHTLSQSDGTFLMSGAPLGNGVLTAQLTGYEISSVPVTITAGLNTLAGDIQMAQLSGDPPNDQPRTVQGTITLTGTSNATGVVVTLLSGTSTYDQMTTASDGNYHFWAPVGTYTARAARTGFTTKEQQVSVTDLTKVVTLNITLNP